MYFLGSRVEVEGVTALFTVGVLNRVKQRLVGADQEGNRVVHLFVELVIKRLDGRLHPLLVLRVSRISFQLDSSRCEAQVGEQNVLTDAEPVVGLLLLDRIDTESSEPLPEFVSVLDMKLRYLSVVHVALDGLVHLVAHSLLDHDEEQYAQGSAEQKHEE